MRVASCLHRTGLRQSPMTKVIKDFFFWKKVITTIDLG